MYACPLLKPKAKSLKQAYAPVMGSLNLDGALDGVGRRGMYKAAKWVKGQASPGVVAAAAPA